MSNNVLSNRRKRKLLFGAYDVSAGISDSMTGDSGRLSKLLPLVTSELWVKIFEFILHLKVYIVKGAETDRGIFVWKNPSWKGLGVCAGFNRYISIFARIFSNFTIYCLCMANKLDKNITTLPSLFLKYNQLPFYCIPEKKTSHISKSKRNFLT